MGARRVWIACWLIGGLLAASSAPAHAQTPAAEGDAIPVPVDELAGVVLPDIPADTLTLSESFSFGLPTLSLATTNTSQTLTSTGPTLLTSGTLLSGLGSLSGLASSASGVYPGLLPSALALSGCSSGFGRDPCLAFASDLSGLYSRMHERTAFGYDVVAYTRFAPSVVSGSQSLSGGRTTSTTLNLNPTVSAEIRWYPAAPAVDFFLFANQSLGDSLWWYHADGDSDRSNTVSAWTRAGVGWGRVLPVGAPTRLRKLLAHLDARGALNGPVPDDVADEILRYW